MERKEVEIGNPVTVEEITIIPVAALSLNYWSGKDKVSLLGIKQPIAIIAISPPEKKAFRATGEEIPLGQLIKEIPETREILDKLS